MTTHTTTKGRQITWSFVEGRAWSGEQTDIGPFVLFVGYEDEGPLTPAYYWSVSGPGEPHPAASNGALIDGFGRTRTIAKRDALKVARALRREMRGA